MEGLTDGLWSVWDTQGLAMKILGIEPTVDTLLTIFESLVDLTVRSDLGSPGRAGVYTDAGGLRAGQNIKEPERRRMQRLRLCRDGVFTR